MGLAARPGRGVPAVHDAHQTRRTTGWGEGAPDRTAVSRPATGGGVADRSRREPPLAPAPAGSSPRLNVGVVVRRVWPRRHP